MLLAYHRYALLRDLSLGLSLPISVTFLVENNYSAWHIGLLGTVMELSKLIFELPTGKLTDTYGVKIPLTLSGLLGALLWLGYPLFTGNLMIYYTCSVLLGAAEALVTGSLETWISSEVTQAKITKTLLHNTNIMLVAAIIAGFVSGWAYQFSTFYCFVTISLINLLKAYIPISIRLKNYQSQHEVQQVTFQQSLRICIKYMLGFVKLRGLLWSSLFVTTWPVIWFCTIINLTCLAMA